MNIPEVLHVASTTSWGSRNLIGVPLLTCLRKKEGWNKLKSEQYIYMCDEPTLPLQNCPPWRALTISLAFLCTTFFPFPCIVTWCVYYLWRLLPYVYLDAQKCTCFLVNAKPVEWCHGCLWQERVCGVITNKIWTQESTKRSWYAIGLQLKSMCE